MIKTVIIILNWNGWKDTIECLGSLYKVIGSDFLIVVADNGSKDDSLLRISEWLSDNKVNSTHIKEGELMNIHSVAPGSCVLYSLRENYGFAKGNNKALEFISCINPTYFLLLNNDTLVMPDFLIKLELFMSIHTEYKALTPLIRLYPEKDKIWNCGGRLTAGFRKYYYADMPLSSVTESSHIDITFITGCALFFKRELINNEKLFTERFFFGEEDFDFSLRMKRSKNKMACLIDSQIFHKVSSSNASAKFINKTYVYYLNRFIDVRLHYGWGMYFLWLIIYLPYIALLLYKIDTKTNKIVQFISKLFVDSIRLEGVSKTEFNKIMNL